MSAVDSQSKAVQISYGLPIMVKSAPFTVDPKYTIRQQIKCKRIHLSIISTIIDQICGDCFKTGNEQCDDCNTLNGDGCNLTCIIEAGWTCNGVSNIASNKCIEICGDGKRFNSIFALINLTK